MSNGFDSCRRISWTIFCAVWRDAYAGFLLKLGVPIVGTDQQIPGARIALVKPAAMERILTGADDYEISSTL
jgi:hypothetical protein